MRQEISRFRLPTQDSLPILVAAHRNALPSLVVCWNIGAPLNVGLLPPLQIRDGAQTHKYGAKINTVMVAMMRKDCLKYYFLAFHS